MVVDRCDVCGGSDACVDCEGVPFGDASIDSCGICAGDNSSSTSPEPEPAQVVPNVIVPRAVVVSSDGNEDTQPQSEDAIAAAGGAAASNQSTFNSLLIMLAVGVCGGFAAASVMCVTHRSWRPKMCPPEFLMRWYHRGRRIGAASAGTLTKPCGKLGASIVKSRAESQARRDEKRGMKARRKAYEYAANKRSDAAADPEQGYLVSVRGGISTTRHKKLKANVLGSLVAQSGGKDNRRAVAPLDANSEAAPPTDGKLVALARGKRPPPILVGGGDSTPRPPPLHPDSIAASPSLSAEEQDAAAAEKDMQRVLGGVDWVAASMALPASPTGPGSPMIPPRRSLHKSRSRSKSRTTSRPGGKTGV